MSEQAAGARQPYGSSTVDRALDILTAVGSSAAGLTNADISTQLGLDRSTAHRLASTLERKGFLLRLADRSYVIGPRMQFLAWGTGADLKSMLGVMLDELSAASGESASYSTAFGDSYYCIAVRPGPHELNYHPIAATSYALHTSATGLAIWAFAPTTEQERLLAAGPFPATTTRTMTDPDEIRAELTRVRERGYAISAGTRAPGGCSIARPVFNGPGVVTGALTLSAAEQRTPLDTLISLDPLLEAAAARLSISMGWQPDE